MRRVYRVFSFQTRAWGPEYEARSAIELLSKQKDLDLTCPRFVKIVSTGEIVECLFQNGQWVLAIPNPPV